MNMRPPRTFVGLLACWLFLLPVISCHELALAEKSDSAAWIYRKWQTFTTKDGLCNDRIRAIHVQGKKVWVGTDDGLALYEEGAWKCWTIQQGLKKYMLKE